VTYDPHPHTILTWYRSPTLILVSIATQLDASYTLPPHSLWPLHGKQCGSDRTPVGGMNYSPHWDSKGFKLEKDRTHLATFSSEGWSPPKLPVWSSVPHISKCYNITQTGANPKKRLNSGYMNNRPLADYPTHWW